MNIKDCHTCGWHNTEPPDEYCTPYAEGDAEVEAWAEAMPDWENGLPIWYDQKPSDCPGWKPAETPRERCIRLVKAAVEACSASEEDINSLLAVVLQEGG